MGSIILLFSERCARSRKSGNFPLDVELLFGRRFVSLVAMCVCRELEGCNWFYQILRGHIVLCFS